MGNQQPKKIGKATKAQIDIASLKAKIHLELMRDRKNAEIIKGQKQLVAKIKSNRRNKTEEILMIERIVCGLKYTQACHHLIGYAIMLRPQAQFISKNMMLQDKMEPFLTPIYTLIYAASIMGLSSLKEFRDLMKALNDPTSVGKYVNQEVMQLLSPKPTPEELNIYMLEMVERNNLTLEQINIVGHKFTRDMKPSSSEDSFAEYQRELAEKMKKQMEQNYGPGGQHRGGYPGGQPGGYPGGQPGGYSGGQSGGYPGGGYSGEPGGYPGGQDQPGFSGGFGPNNPSNKPNYYDVDKNIPIPTQNSSFGNQSFDSNPYGIRQSVNPNEPSFSPQDNDMKQSFSNPKDSNPNNYMNSKASIDSINQLDFFPEITPVVKPDPEFDRICDILRAAM